MEPSAVEVSSVSKRFGRTLALDGVSLEIRRGEPFALLGPNGAGKTTLSQAVLARSQPGVVFRGPGLDSPAPSL